MKMELKQINKTKLIVEIREKYMWIDWSNENDFALVRNSSKYPRETNGSLAAHAEMNGQVDRSALLCRNASQ